MHSVLPTYNNKNNNIQHCVAGSPDVTPLSKLVSVIKLFSSSVSSSALWLVGGAFWEHINIGSSGISSFII